VQCRLRGHNRRFNLPAIGHNRRGRLIAACLYPQNMNALLGQIGTFQFICL